MKLSPEIQEQLDQGHLLPVMEDFYTIQGEGRNTGYAAYFIRLGGCDVGCHWCDVKESWDSERHPLRPVDEVVSEAMRHTARSIVITGGEPLMYNLEPLTTTLHRENVSIFLETSGAYPMSGHFDWVCVSPKKFKAPRPDMLERADELKVIVFNKSDFEWAEKHASAVRPDCALFLQPEWSKCEQLLPEIIEYVKRNPQWRVSLQTHKYMHIP